jgi:hypothetical protein
MQFMEGAAFALPCYGHMPFVSAARFVCSLPVFLCAHNCLGTAVPGTCCLLWIAWKFGVPGRLRACVCVCVCVEPL